MLVKLFYKNDNSTAIALRKFRILKEIQRASLIVKLSLNSDNQIKKKRVCLKFIREEEVGESILYSELLHIYILTTK